MVRQKYNRERGVGGREKSKHCAVQNLLLNKIRIHVINSIKKIRGRMFTLSVEGCLH